MGCWIASARSWRPVPGSQFSVLSGCGELLSSLHSAATPAVSTSGLFEHYCFACATLSVQGPAVGVNEQNGFRLLGALGNEMGAASLPPTAVPTSWSKPSLPA